MKIMNRITFRCSNSNNKKKPNRSKEFYISTESYQGALLPHNHKHLSVIKSKINPFHSIANMFRNKLKLSLLVVTSLTTALAFLLAVSAIRSQMIQYKIDQYQNHFRAKDPEAKANDLQAEQVINELDQKTSKFTLVHSYDICKLINDQFFEDYIIIFISFPITVLIYLWNAYKCNKDHEYHCRFANIRIKRKNREKNLSYNAESSK